MKNDEKRWFLQTSAVVLIGRFGFKMMDFGFKRMHFGFKMIDDSDWNPQGRDRCDAGRDFRSSDFRPSDFHSK